MDESEKSPKNPEFLQNSKYYERVKSLQDESPHLRSLSSYMETAEKLRLDGKVGSPNSNSILVAEIRQLRSLTHDDTSYVYKRGVHYHRIDCYDAADTEKFKDIGSTPATRSSEDGTKVRVLIVEDLSPGAIELLGTEFDMDPNVFYFHLGVNEARHEISEHGSSAPDHDTKNIPLPSCMQDRMLDNFISIPIPCDKNELASGYLNDLNTDMTYSAKFFRPIFELPSAESHNGRPLQRTFNRITLIFANNLPNPKNVPTVIILAFPTWGRHKLLGIEHFGLRFPDSRKSFFDPRHHKSDTLAVQQDVGKEGCWLEGQHDRIDPIVNGIFYGLGLLVASHLSWAAQPQPSWQVPTAFVELRKRSFLWLYSFMSKTYFVACQNEGRCWREIQNILECHEKPDDYASLIIQQSFRKVVRKTAHFLEDNKNWSGKYNTASEDDLHCIGANDNNFFEYSSRVEITLASEKARIAEVQQSIEDLHREVEVKLAVAKLRRAMTPPQSPTVGASDGYGAISHVL